MEDSSLPLGERVRVRGIREKVGPKDFRTKQLAGISDLQTSPSPG